MLILNDGTIFLFPDADQPLSESDPRNQRLDPDTVLKESIGEFDQVVVLGRDHSGKLSLRSSESTFARALLLMEEIKYDILSMGPSVD